jgi:hypothetical protein
MRLVPKKVLFYLFINYNVVTSKIHPLCLHTPFPAVQQLFEASLEHILWDLFKTWLTDLWMSSKESKWCPFTADFTF